MALRVAVGLLPRVPHLQGVAARAVTTAPTESQELLIAEAPATGATCSQTILIKGLEEMGLTHTEIRSGTGFNHQGCHVQVGDGG
jgi:hypothetical protein